MFSFHDMNGLIPLHHLTNAKRKHCNLNYKHPSRKRENTVYSTACMSRVAITYIFHVADTLQNVVVGGQGSDIMGISHRRCVLGGFRQVPSDEHLLRGHSSQRGGFVFIQVLPVDACCIVHVLEQVVFIVRLHGTVHRHGASLLVTPLGTSHPDSRVQHPAYVQGYSFF